jgi:hypothetical protein
VYQPIRAPRPVRDIPTRSLAMAMADQLDDRLAPFKLAMPSLPSTARVPATHACSRLFFGHLKAVGDAGFGEPNREPAPTDCERRWATSWDHRSS